MFRTIRRRNLFEEVAGQVEELIRRGVYKDGDRLPGERELAERLGVNRATVREALRVLEIMRVVEKKPGEGVFVRDIHADASLETVVFQFLSQDGLDQDTLASLIEAIKYIESTTARLAARRVTSGELEELVALQKRAERQSPDTGAHAAHDREFHLLVGRISKNDVLLKVMNTIWTIMEKYSDLLLAADGNHQDNLAYHKALVKAIAAKDADRAYQEMKAHFQWVERQVLGTGKKDKDAGPRS